MADLPYIVFALQEKYTALCAEKCRLLNRIEAVHREARHLRTQNRYREREPTFLAVSRIVDMLAEVVTRRNPLITFNDGWSDGEEWETDPFSVADLDVREYERSHALVRQQSFSVSEAKSKRPRMKKPSKAEEQDDSLADAPEADGVDF